MKDDKDNQVMLVPDALDEEPQRVNVNRRCHLLKGRDGFVVVVNHSPWHWCRNTEEDRRIVAANLCLSGVAGPLEVVHALGVPRATLHRDRQRLLKEGLGGLVNLRTGPKGPSKVTRNLRTRGRMLFQKGVRKAEIARRLGLGESTVGRLVKDLEPKKPVQPSLPTEEVKEVTGEEADGKDEKNGTPVVTATSTVEGTERSGEEKEEKIVAVGSPECMGEERGTEVEKPESVAFRPEVPHRECPTEEDLDRGLDRALARCGAITEASVCFVPGQGLRFVGALLLIPPLVGTGLFDAVEAVYGKLRNGFYGLRHTVMTLVLMAGLRVRQAEGLVRTCPGALGRLLGLDRAPEVKTLRRRLEEIGQLGRADRLMQWLGRYLAEGEPEALAYLYVDGHVRPYFGKRRISKAHVTQMRISMPATTDFWVHDEKGEPILVVTGEVVSALTRQILPILKEVRPLLGPGKRATVVFDRGGWSPKLFRKIVKMGFDFLTYRKGKSRRYPEGDFSWHTLKVEDGEDGEDREERYELRDGWCRAGGLRLRCVVRRRDDGHQTPIVTNRTDLAAADVAYRMFNRWRQENFFKYAVKEFALDALDTYDIESDDPERTVPNPRRRKIDRKLAHLRREEEVLAAELGRTLEVNQEGECPTVRGFKITHASLREARNRLQEQIHRLEEHRRALPDRVPLRQITRPDQPPIKLEVERKHFTNILKLAVYRAETKLFRSLEPYYARNEEEGRKLLDEAFHSSGSIDIQEGMLRVVLNPLSAPRRTRALHGLCCSLNDHPVRIPGTTLRLHLAVRGQ